MSEPAFATRDESSETNMTLTVDLRNMFDTRVVNEATRLRVGQAVIDQMRANAKAGKFIDESGDSQTYSAEYKASNEFQAFGKSNNVNLTLTGAMLNSMQVVSHDAESVTIGFSGPKQSQKAHGHVRGANDLPKRDFFGLNAQDMGKIIREFKPEVERQPEVTPEQERLLEIERVINERTGVFNGGSQSERAGQIAVSLQELERLFGR